MRLRTRNLVGEWPPLAADTTMGLLRGVVVVVASAIGVVRWLVDEVVGFCVENISSIATVRVIVVSISAFLLSKLCMDFQEWGLSLESSLSSGKVNDVDSKDKDTPKSRAPRTRPMRWICLVEESRTLS